MVVSYKQREKGFFYLHLVRWQMSGITLFKFNPGVLGEVTLRLENGEVVNEKMQALLNTEVKPDSKGKLTLESMHKFIPPIGEEIKYMVTQTDPLYMAEFDLFLKFDEENSIKIKEHCENPEVPPYNPCQGELCLVKFEDFWYRAHCLKETASGVSIVRLIDYGNIEEIPFGDIRQMLSEFVTFPPLALAVRIQGMPENVSAELRSLLEEKLAAFKSFSGIITRFNEKEEVFEGNFPSFDSSLFSA